MTLVNLARNFGEHNAVMAGLRQARGAHVITMDDDLQNPPGEVLRLLRIRAEERQATWSIPATREKQHARWRNLGSRFTNRVADWLLDKPKGLYLSSFRCMSAFVAKAVTAMTGPFPYIDGLIMQVTQSIGSSRSSICRAAQGAATTHFRRLVRLWLNMFVNFSVMPLRLSTLAGFALSVLGLFGFAWVVAEAIFARRRRAGPRWRRRCCCSRACSSSCSASSANISAGSISPSTASRKAIVSEIVRSDPASRAAPAAERAAAPAIAVRQADGAMPYYAALVVGIAIAAGGQILLKTGAVRTAGARRSSSTPTPFSASAPMASRRCSISSASAASRCRVAYPTVALSYAVVAMPRITCGTSASAWRRSPASRSSGAAILLLHRA